MTKTASKPTDETVEAVNQADREAAAALIIARPMVENPDIILHGGADDGAFVQAFAKHRIAALSIPQGDQTEALERIKAHVEVYDTPKDDDPRRRYTVAQLETAIRLAARIGRHHRSPVMNNVTTMRALWRPISELDDIYQQPIWIASPKLIHGDSNPLGIAEAYWQDSDGPEVGEWRTTSFDMCNDVWDTITLAQGDVTHFLIPEGPWFEAEAALKDPSNSRDEVSNG